MFNLAESVWMGIHCAGPIWKHVLCTGKQVKDNKHTKNWTELCVTKDFIGKNKHCFFIRWFQGKVSELKTWTKPENRFLAVLKSEAVGTNLSPLILERPADGVKLLTYTLHFKAQSTKFQSGQLSFVEGTVVEESKLFNMSHRTFQNSLFLCKNTSFMSILHICDGTMDCSSTGSEDEQDCVCKNGIVHSEVQKNQTCKWQCPLFPVVLRSPRYVVCPTPSKQHHKVKQ